jgi:hypothetical protein
MASLSPPPKLQFFGSDGLPLVGGKLYTYAAGTTTPLATYTDSTGVTQNTNPVILDSSGQAGVWLPDTTTYKYVLKTSADVTLYTVDYVSVPLTSNSFASPPPIGSSVPNAGTFTTLIATGQVTFASTGAAVINVGTTSERPATPQTGMIRYNSTISKYEGYAGTAWGQLGGGATGGGTDQVFIQNGQTVTTDYTITTSNNAGTFGPVSIDTGITVTVPTGSVWSIV